MRSIAVILMVAWTGTAGAETVTRAVFEAGSMRGIEEATLLRYRFEMSGSSIAEAFVSKIDVDVREVADDGSKKVWVDMFDGANARHLGPIEAKGQNPLVLTFLQRDVTQMGNLTGGAAGYFQQQLRRSFNNEADAEAIEVTLDGRTGPATRLTIRPYRDDPKIARFPQFKEKAYQFTIADWIPGGVWQLSTVTPDAATGKVILQETVTFDREGS